MFVRGKGVFHVNLDNTKSHLGDNGQVIITWLIVFEVWLLDNTLQIPVLHVLHFFQCMRFFFSPVV